MSVSCALWATSLHQWARRYIRLTQPERCSPEKQARMRAFFANGVGKMHIPWAVEGLPTLLHLSLFLFFGGLIIFLFNTDREVFICVVSWIGLFSVVYGLITLLPLFRQDSPYYSPLSLPAWFLYASIQYVIFTILAFIAACCCCYRTWERCDDLMDRYRGWILGGVEKIAEETALEQSWDIDVGILDWTISALGDDDSLERFFETIPGFFNSKLVNHLREHLPDDLSRRLWGALDRFLDRTLTSNLVVDSVKLHRLDISMSTMKLIPVPGMFWSVLGHSLFRHWDKTPPTIEIGHYLARWCTCDDQRTAQYARRIVSKVLATVRERDDCWVQLAARAYDLPERDITDIVTHGDDSVSLAILIHLTRKSFRFDPLWGLVGTFTEFDIRNALSGLQHDFCTLWNEIVQEAKNQGPYTISSVGILSSIRNHYYVLHQGTDAAPTAFSLSTNPFDSILDLPSSYPSCDIASHRPHSIAHALLAQPAESPDASPHRSTSGCSVISRRVKEASIIAGPPSPSHQTIPGKIGDNSQALAVTSPASSLPTSICPTDASPPGAAATALQDIPPTATLSHPREGTTQLDIVSPCVEPGISEKMSPVSMLTPTPTLARPTSTPPILNKSLEICDAGEASTSDPLLPASSVVDFSVPASRTTSNATLPRLRARGLVNIGSMCPENAVFQLLVHSPPFWNLFRELDNLKGQHGGGPETGSSATPLMDATIKFCDEFVYEEELSMTQQFQQQAARGEVRRIEEGKKEHNVVDSFNPRYMYDAMKEKRQLKDFLVRSRDRDAPFCN